MSQMSSSTASSSRNERCKYDAAKLDKSAPAVKFELFSVLPQELQDKIIEAYCQLNGRLIEVDTRDVDARRSSDRERFDGDRVIMADWHSLDNRSVRFFTTSPVPAVLLVSSSIRKEAKRYMKLFFGTIFNGVEIIRPKIYFNPAADTLYPTHSSSLRHLDLSQIMSLALAKPIEATSTLWPLHVHSPLNLPWKTPNRNHEIDFAYWLPDFIEILPALKQLSVHPASPSNMDAILGLLPLDPAEVLIDLLVIWPSGTDMVQPVLKTAGSIQEIVKELQLEYTPRGALNFRESTRPIREGNPIVGHVAAPDSHDSATVMLPTRAAARRAMTNTDSHCRALDGDLHGFISQFEFWILADGEDRHVIASGLAPQTHQFPHTVDGVLDVTHAIAPHQSFLLRYNTGDIFIDVPQRVILALADEVLLAEEEFSADEEMLSWMPRSYMRFRPEVLRTMALRILEFSLLRILDSALHPSTHGPICLEYYNARERRACPTSLSMATRFRQGPVDCESTFSPGFLTLSFQDVQPLYDNVALEIEIPPLSRGFLGGDRYPGPVPRLPRIPLP